MSKIIEDLNWRYATDLFDPNKKVSDTNLKILKETLRLTATSYGLQCMKIFNVESKEIRELLTSAAYGQSQVKDASHLFILCAYKTVREQDIEEHMNLIAKTRDIPRESLDGYAQMLNTTVGSWSEQNQRTWTSKQTYIALGKLLQSCARLRIDALPMEGFNADKVDEILNLKDSNLTATLFCPIGYRHEDDPIQHEIKVRKTIDQLIETV
jgi:nitroreductase